MDRKTQLYFHDDGSFEFIKRPLEYSCLLEKNGEKIKRAWRHSFSGEYFFQGYKNIPADMVTLGFSRDIILDPQNRIPVTEDTSGKPASTKIDIKKWIAQIAENQRHIFRSKRKSTTKHDLFNYCLMGTLSLMVIGLVIGYATG
jgi:hypothetical protein